MPELPEVHTISTDLNKHISGYVIKEVEIIPGYRVSPDTKTFKEKITGMLVDRVRRVAKNIIFDFSSGNHLQIHLAMTGQLLLKEPGSEKPKWTRVILHLQKNGDNKTLFFTDMRMFGKAAYIKGDEFHKISSKYGPEPISAVTPVEFFKQIRSKRTTVKNVLLDQSIVSGLGNIYATDALFLAAIHPETPTSQITPEMAEKLLASSRQVLEEGIKHRGSTLSDRMYVDIFGKEGSHQKHFKIYGKKECPVCGGPVEFKKISGRGTYFCPVCQPLENQAKLL